MAQPSDRPSAAIVSLDLHGYSRLTEQDEVGTHRAWMACWRDKLEPVIADHRGAIVKSTGDGALISFSDAAAALDAMIRFQEIVTEAEARFPECRRLVFRIGIHVAPAIHENGDVFGHGVNLAVRLQENAEPGSIVISEMAVSHLAPDARAPLENLGKQRFKNIKERVGVYCWRGEQTPVAYLPTSLMRAAAVLLFALVMPTATSDDRTTAQKRHKVAEATGLSESSADIHMATIAAQPMRDHDIATHLSSDRKLIAKASSIIEAGERAALDDEWIQPFHGLVSGPLKTPVRTTLAAAERSLENRSEIAEDAYLQALALYNRHTPGSFAKAIEELENALTLKADYSAAHALLAAIYWGGLQNRWQVGQGLTRAAMLGIAERHLALATDNDPLAQLVTSEMLTARGQHDLAIKRAARLVASSPESAIGHYTRGRTLLFAGRADEAEGHIRIAIRLDPHAPRYLFGLAMVQFSINRFADAQRTLARLTERNGDNDWPHLLMAATQGYLGLKADARRAIGRFDRLSVERRGWFASQIPYVHSWPFQDDEDHDRLHLGLVLAGIPEPPH
ncbi:MAG: adenylate/guanylate cyclase domain-containing protein [Pseudomonadota bacterium]